jgi:hypothetical protein
VVLKRISTGDENESALLSKLLGTIVEGGQEKVLSHIPAPCPRSLASGSSASFFCVVNILVLCHDDRREEHRACRSDQEQEEAQGQLRDHPHAA